MTRDVGIEPVEATPGGRSGRTGSLVQHLVSIGVAAVFVLPLVWVVSASLRQPGLPPPEGIEWIPDPISLEAYQRLTQLLPFGRYLLNSLLVVAVAIPVTLLVASWAGFAIAQLRGTHRRRLVALAVGLLLVPASALWLTRYLVFRQLGVLDSLLALIAPAFMGSSPLFVLLFYWAFRRLPPELVETARLEGAGPLTAWRRVAMPLALPTVVVVVLLTFLLSWSDFLGPQLYLRSQDLYTLPVGLRQLQTLDRTNWPVLMAGSVVLAIPAVVVFAVVQRWFLRAHVL
jgi:multiple sugar transport system permease protein